LWRFLYLNLRSDYVHNINNFIFQKGVYLVYKVYPVDYNRKLRIALTMISLVYLPRILTFSVFFYEIVVNKKLDIFYHIAVILLIPMLFSSLKFILIDVTHFRDFELQRNFLKVTYIDEDAHIYTTAKRFETISDNLYKVVRNEWHNWKEIEYLVIFLFYPFQEKYDYISSLIVSILLMFSFLVWLLTILKLY
jgi:hypothetical protein